MSQIPPPQPIPIRSLITRSLAEDRSILHNSLGGGRQVGTVFLHFALSNLCWSCHNFFHRLIALRVLADHIKDVCANDFWFTHVLLLRNAVEMRLLCLMRAVRCSNKRFGPRESVRTIFALSANAINMCVHGFMRLHIAPTNTIAKSLTVAGPLTPTWRLFMDRSMSLFSQCAACAYVGNCAAQLRA
jgi:hypothetical protein